jgi:DHA1 family bicyclomycin/chloramphenicol resistance-like MFS transporter
MPFRRSPRFLAVLVLVTALGPLSMQMFVPSLEAIRADFGVGAGIAWMALTLPMAAIGIATLLFGPISDRVGRKPVLVAGVVVFCLGSVLGILAADIVLVIGGRVLQAAGASAGIVLARAIARDLYGFEDSVRVISYLTMAMIVAPMLAPAAGGFLHDAFGWRSIFYVMAAIGLAVLPALTWGLYETLKQKVSGGWRELAGGTRALITTRRFLGYALLSTASMCVFFSFLAAAPYLMNGVLKRPVSEYGVWFMSITGVFVLGTFTSTRLLARCGPDRLIAMGTLLTVPVLAATIPIYLHIELSPALLFIPASVASFLQGFIIPNCQACAINVNPRLAGTASGLTGFAQMAVAALVAQTVGQLADGTIWPMAIFMLLSACAGVLILPLIRARTGTKVGNS